MTTMTTPTRHPSRGDALPIKRDELNHPSPAGAPIGTVLREVLSWDGVSAAEHRFGGTELRLGETELGHFHGGPGGRGVADLRLPVALAEELIAAGRARRHPVATTPGWVHVPLRNAAEADRVRELFRVNYERALAG